MICALANGLWLAGCLPELRRFHRAAAHVRDEQERILRRLLQRNAATEFGRLYGFATIGSIREYRQRVPLRTFEEYEPWIDRAAGGAPAVLTSEPVHLMEPTSGSTGSAKLIPYTRSARREFQRAIRAWVADLLLRRPALLAGRAYWSVSPAGAARARTRGGIPIGFDDDASYLGGWQQRLVRATMAAPPALRQVTDVAAFHDGTLRALIRCPDLRLISVWNPTFLSLLADRLAERGDALVRELTDGPARDRLRAALRARTVEERHATLWPRLRVISCWTDANAAGPAARLARLFPHAEMQGKGLIATEGIVSWPLAGHEGAVLAVRSHFLEFAPVDAHQRVSEQACLLADELEAGRRYAVILSTGAGLYRYRLHDVVEVVGHAAACPLVKFVGRLEQVSDWFGEKLNEIYVARVLRDAAAALGMSPSFAMVACDRALPRPAYVLYVEADEPDASLARLAGRVEAGLRAAFHYDYARRLGQLGPLRVFRASGAAERYLLSAARSGRGLGHVKPVALDRRDGWSQRLPGAFVPPSDPAGIDHPATAAPRD